MEREDDGAEVRVWDGMLVAGFGQQDLGVPESAAAARGRGGGGGGGGEEEQAASVQEEAGLEQEHIQPMEKAIRRW